MPFKAIRPFSKWIPTHRTEETEIHNGARLLVFECVPEQYRQVYQWLQENPTEKGTLLYRLRIPCVRSGEIYDWSEYIQEYPGREETFTGVFEAWPATRRYEIVPLESAEFIRKNGYECEEDVTLPEFFTGLSKIQAAILAEPSNNTNVIVEGVCAKLFASKDLVHAHLRGLCRGNLPLITRHGNLLKRNQPSPFFPYYLVNGPYPYAHSTVVRVLKSMLKGLSLAFLDGMPVCAPYRFERNERGEIWSYGHTTGDGVIVFPYGDDDPNGPNGERYVRFFEELNGKIHGKWKDASVPPSVRIHEGERTWTFLHEGKQRTFRMSTEYLEEWFKLRTMGMALARPRETLLEKTKARFLRDLYEGTTYEVRTETTLEEKRVFIWETLDAKRARIRKDYHGFYELMDLPVKAITPENLFISKEEEEEGQRVLGGGYNARDTFAEKLEEFEASQLVL